MLGLVEQLSHKLSNFRSRHPSRFGQSGEFLELDAEDIGPDIPEEPEGVFGFKKHKSAPPTDPFELSFLADDDIVD